MRICTFYCLKQISKFGVIDEANKFETARNNTQHVAELPAAKSQCLALEKYLKCMSLFHVYFPLILSY